MSEIKADEASGVIVTNLDDAKLKFGSWLRGVREGAGLSLDAVAHQTKINKNYLLSLESGDLSALPGKVFGRGFVKSITRLLKTDGEEGLRLYDACWGSAIIAAVPDSPASNLTDLHNTKSVKARISEPINTSSVVTRRLMGGGFAPAGEKPRLPSMPRSADFWRPSDSMRLVFRSFMSPYLRLWVLGLAVTLFAGLVFGRWAASHWHQQRLSSNRNHAASLSTTVTSTPAQAGQNVASNDLSNSNMGAVSSIDGLATVTTLPVKTLAKNEDNPLYLPSASGVAFEQVLELRVINPVEIRLTIDGKKQENTWFKSDSYRFTFSNLAELYLLDASEVEVTYNGQPLGVLGNKGRKRRIYFQAKAASSDFPL